MIKSLNSVVVCLLVFFWGISSHGTDLRIYGFADIVASQTTTKFPLNGIGNNKRNVNLDPETRFGLNFSSDLGENFRFAGQMLAQGNDQGAYKFTADWIFVTYQPDDNFTVRVGRQITPLFLYSEQIDVGFTYLWARLPFELYEVYPVKSFNGVSAAYSIPVGDYRFKAKIFGGGGDASLEDGSTVIYGSSKDTRGLNLAVFNDNSKFHAAYIGTRADGAITINPVPGSPTNVPIDFGTFHVLSMGGSWQGSKFLLAAEAGRTLVDDGSFVRSASGAYGSVGYNLTSKLSPYMTYAWQGSVDGTVFLHPDGTTSKTGQESYMLGLNYKATSSLALKGEVMRTQISYENSDMTYGANTYTISLDMIF